MPELDNDALAHLMMSDAGAAQMAREAAAAKLKQRYGEAFVGAHPWMADPEAMGQHAEGVAGRITSDVVPMALGGPVTGAISKGIGTAIKAAPGLSALAGGAGAAMLASDAGSAQGERPGSGAEWWRTPRDPYPTRDTFIPPTLTPEEEAQFKPPVAPPSRRGSVENIRAKSAADLQQRRADFLDKKVATAKEGFDATQAAKIEAYQKEQERLDALDQEYKQQNQSFKEAHPYASLALPGVAAVVASRIPFGQRLRSLAQNNDIVKLLEGGVERAKGALEATGPEAAAGRVGAGQELKTGLGPKVLGSMKNVNPSTFSPSGLGKLATGAGLTGEASLLPYEIDQGTLPKDSPGRAESSDWRNWVQRGLFGSIAGASGANAGLHYPLPRGTPQMVPPIAEMEGLMAALKKPKKK